MIGFSLEIVKVCEEQAHMKYKGGFTLFLEKSEKYKKYSEISRYFFIGTLVMMIVSIISNLVFDGAFGRSIIWIGTVLFIIGIIVSAIPDFLEKDRRKIVFDTVYILIIVIVLFYLLT